ncbi:late trypsin-like protein [Leptotrombidium deliense]|uniref:Late trypsin-like protein n=1 Tax=Leptotrombidium deliense TaxID=299467 RepID=A0A443S4J5_9ACAR|nr:late trypsin-like protein [Leptotrombidium deliense]
MFILIFIFVTFSHLLFATIPCGVRNINGAGFDRFILGIETKNEFISRVINGRSAYFGEVPWVTELQIRKGRSGYLCGGAILDRNTVLTAAHCIYSCEREIPEQYSAQVCPSLKADVIRVCIGERNTADPNDGQTCYDSKKYFSHEQYKCCSGNHFNDIAIIKIVEGMDVPRFTKNGLGSTNSICLPNVDVTTGPAYIAGWGRNNANTGSIPMTLQTASVNVISLQQCQKTFGQYVADKQTCALGSRGESACSGDSGSSIFVEDRNQVSTAVGVTSFVANMRCTGNPVAYAKIYSYLDFIKKNMG